MASVFTLKRKTFGKKFDEYIKKNNLKVEDAEEIVEKGAKKIKLGKPSKIAAGVALGLAAAGSAAAMIKNKKNKKKEQED